MLSLFGGLLLATVATGTVLPRQSQDGCTDQTIRTDIGLEFDVSCESNIADYDIRNSRTSNLTDCLNTCATSGAGTDQNPCQAVAYNINDGRCYQKDGNATAADVSFSNITIMAFAQDVWTDRGQNYACTNGSIQTDSNGYQYRIYCGYRHNGDNYDINKRPDYQPFHADTLDDCLNYCSRGGPLCRGVLYSEGLRTGYRNCYPKSVNGSDPFKLVPDPGTTTAIGILSVNSTCTSSSYTASGGGVFNTSCDTTGSGPDIKKVHSDNFEACIDECANYRPENGGNSCFGVLYEPSASGGFQNCYLKYDLQNRTSGNFNLAVLAEAGNGNGDDDSSSNAWIAGVVVGPVVAIAAAVGAFFWWRRRRAAKTQPSEDKTEGEPFRDLGTPHASSPYLDQVPPKYDASSQPPTTPSATSMPTPPAAAELGTGPRPTQELPAREQPRFEMQG